MTPEQIVEATLFASQTPLTPGELARADESLDVMRVTNALQALRERYDEEEHAFQVYQLGDGYQLLTRPEYAPYLERFDSVARPPALSRAALETLAIIAYRQPIGRLEIEEIRGVVSTTVLRTLQDWELIGIVGRGEGLGRPLLYGTTRVFLDHFGFQSLTELPRPEDLPVALRGAEVTVERATQEGVSPAPEGESPTEEPPTPESPTPDDVSRTSASNGRGQDQDGSSSSGNGSRPTLRGSA